MTTRSQAAPKPLDSKLMTSVPDSAAHSAAADSVATDSVAAPPAAGSATPASGHAERGRVRLDKGHKRVRAFLAGRVVADTQSPWLVWEAPQYPTYYVPREDVRAELKETGATEHSPSRGEAAVCDVVVDGAVAEAAALVYAESPIPELRGLVKLRWDAMDDWMEEDELVYTHPRDPYTRVDILASSRRVQVLVDGVEVASSDQPRILFETGLPPRYYLPLSHVRTELLRPSSSVTHCPYKGDATYWSIEVNGKVYEDYVWIYRAPLPESQKIAGLACFYNEKVDLVVDGVPLERPRTKFS